MCTVLPPPGFNPIAVNKYTNTIVGNTQVETSWNVMAHAQKPHLVFRRNGRVHLNRRRRQFSRLLAAEVCASAVVMLDTPCSEVVWRVLATHSICQFPLHFPYHASPCAITFQLESTQLYGWLPTNLPCVTPQKSEHLIVIAAEGSNHEYFFV